MKTIVSKFGGSSLADAECFHRVRSIISNRKCRQYIVLSAPGKRNPKDEKITDLLVRAHIQYSKYEDYTFTLHTVRDRFVQIIHSLHLNIDADSFLAPLESDIKHSADRAASRGEYLCAQLFSAYTSIPFIDAADLIHFDTNGAMQRDHITHSIRRMAEQYPRAIIPGFYGSMPDGRIKTFSRGGSDISGSLVAAALNAAIYENWTDVDGLMSADPSTCPDAVCHPAVSYRQMHMLATHGAKILHPCCVEPVCETGIPTVLKNTFDPEQPGTYISDHVRGHVPCICVQNGFTSIPYDSLTEESRRIADGLEPENYVDASGRKFIAIKSTDENFIGTPVSVVSAFGLSPALRLEASRNLPSIGEQHSESCSSYLIPPEQARNAQRILHSLVLTPLTESRTL